MTKRELLMELISGLKTEQEDIEFMLRKMPKEKLERFYNVYQEVKANPEKFLASGKTIKDWQITTRWVMMKSR